ncbi:Ig domain-containing protein [Streptomyces sp. SID13588]|uniref:Ig domain-containing protein n=1 Tax=Streptomyces sp. SID13588 TaxID=2706051 RepID=UPI0013C8E1C0|nr:Ig domain-containing protein [Streptomyces sp. SID13588]NEA76712.1 hypothetical protein [Streptomyces sp. SID13588]
MTARTTERHTRSRTRLVVAGTATALLIAGTAGLAEPAVAASPAAVAPSGSGLTVDAGYLRVGLDSTGQVTSLIDSRSGANRVATGHGTAPLVSLVVGGQQVQPTAVTLGAGNTLVFTNAAAGYEVDVAVQDHTTYATFAVTKLVAPTGADVQTLLWGPLPTNVTGTLGESAGVAHDAGFAIGMKPLTDRTEGGWPREDTTLGWEGEVSANPSHLQVAPLEEWSAGASTSWGTLLRAFTFDYTKQRARRNNSGYAIPVGPLPGALGSIVGSKVALFGTTPDLVPTVLSQIAGGQNLPYPTIGGQWQKTAQATSKSVLVLSDLNTGNVTAAGNFAKAAGLDSLYSLPGGSGPWQSAGHYQFGASFGGSDSGATALVNASKANGVAVGAHTLSDFIDPNDGYVTPRFSPDLALGQSTTLTRPMAAGDTTLYLSSCAPLASGLSGRSLLIGGEIVIYAASSQVGSECQVTGLNRGGWGTAAAVHATGGTVARVPQNGYGGALGGLNILDAIATRLSTAWNTTGITTMSFDGLESASQSGWGQYGMARLVNATQKQLAHKDGFLSETSRMGSNIWDGLSRASWGEVGVTSMNQVFINNAYYQANYLPGMLGWISLKGSNSLASVEDSLARGAGLNAGAGFQTSVSNLTANGQNTATLLNAVKQWETARNLGAFTAAQRAQLRDQTTHWHLTVVTAGRSWSLQQLDSSGAPIGAAQTVSVPAPAFATTALPSMTAGQLYEARVITNVPSTVRYTVTSGTLPAGLQLNADTGGITGVPTSGTASTFTVTGTGAPGTGTAQATYTIGAPTGPTTGPLDVTSALNNVGITSQSNVAPGNFDGYGNSFSAEQLAAAGVTPGSTVTSQGFSFVWPNAAMGTADNVKGAATIPGGSRGGSTLAFLGSEAGDVTGTVTVTYTDGTTSTGTVGFPNWTDSSATEFGATLAVSTTGRNRQNGYGNTDHAYRVFSNTIAINPAKTIGTVTLPGSAAIHFFALTVGA